MTLEISNLDVSIGNIPILRDVSLSVPSGKMFGLIGHNGAGKTTLMRAIMGLLDADQGTITFDGQDLRKMADFARAKAGISYMPEDRRLIPSLTVEENMTLAAVSGPINSARLDWIFTAFPPLKTFWKSDAGTLSGGQKQMLSIARAMVEERKLYLIDEPTKGLAPAIISTMAKALKDLKDQGSSVLLVEQNFAVAKALGDSANVMDDGRMIWSGDMAELAHDATLQERLMGLSMEAH